MLSFRVPRPDWDQRPPPAPLDHLPLEADAPLSARHHGKLSLSCHASCHSCHSWRQMHSSLLVIMGRSPLVSGYLNCSCPQQSAAARPVTLDAIVTTVLRPRPEPGLYRVIAITEADTSIAISATRPYTGGCQGLYLNKGDQGVSR